MIQTDADGSHLPIRVVTTAPCFPSQRSLHLFFPVRWPKGTYFYVQLDFEANPRLEEPA